MTRLNPYFYNYLVTKHIRQDDGHYLCIYRRPFTKLEDIISDFPEFNLKELQYLSNTDTILRTNPKFKGMTIKKINRICVTDFDLRNYPKVCRELRVNI